MARGIDVGGIATLGLAAFAGYFIYTLIQNSSASAGIAPPDILVTPNFTGVAPAVTFDNVVNNKNLGDAIALTPRPSVALAPAQTVVDAVKSTNLNTIFSNVTGAIF